MGADGVPSWRVPVVLFIERNCAAEPDAVRAAGLAMECLPDGYGMSYVIGVPAVVTGPVDGTDGWTRAGS